MIQVLINLLVWACIFAAIAYGLYLICVKFLEKFPFALWICGVILLIVLLGALTGQFPETSPLAFPRLR